MFLCGLLLANYWAKESSALSVTLFIQSLVICVQPVLYHKTKNILQKNASYCFDTLPVLTSSVSPENLNLKSCFTLFL